MYFNAIGLAIKNYLASNADLSFIKNFRLVDEPVFANLTEIQIQYDGYKGEFLDPFSHKYCIHNFTFKLIIYSLKPAISIIDENENDNTFLISMVDSIYDALNEQTLDGLLFGDGIKITDVKRASNKKDGNLCHKIVMDIDCKFVNPDDFENAVIGMGYLYYGTSPEAELEYDQITWTKFGNNKIPMTWVERYLLWGGDVGDTSLDDSEPPNIPRDLQIQRNVPMAYGYTLETSDVDVFSIVMGRDKFSTNKIYRNRQGSNISPFTDDLLKAWKFEVTLPGGNKWIEFIPSGVMVPSDRHERNYDDQTVCRLDFEIYPRENDNYASKEKKLGYSILEEAA